MWIRVSLTTHKIVFLNTSPTLTSSVFQHFTDSLPTVSDVAISHYQNQVWKKWPSDLHTRTLTLKRLSYADLYLLCVLSMMISLPGVPSLIVFQGCH